MIRRDFLKLSSQSLASIPFFGRVGESSNSSPFHLLFAPHFGMFRHSAGDDFIDQLHFMHNHGFRAFEDNEMRNRTIDDQKQIATTMQQLGMQMGVFVAHTIYWDKPSLVTGLPEFEQQFLEEIKQSIELSKRINATWMTVVPGVFERNLAENFQTTKLVELLKKASALLEPHNLVMVLEPLNFRDHPNLFLTTSPQAYQICKAVNSPSCKILFDIYHLQIQEGNIIPNIDSCWDEIAYFQIGDNPGRNEPTTGEINYKNVFQHIYEKGFTGILGMEHGNSQPGANGEQKVMDAYRSVDIQK